MNDFVHLCVRSHYTLDEGLGNVEDIAAQAARLRMGALALTERNNLFSAVKFYRAAEKEGIKPIIGADVSHMDAAGNKGRVILLCADHEGFVNLNKLMTKAYGEERHARDEPIIEEAWLAECSDGLIALSGGMQGAVGQALMNGEEQEARRRPAGVDAVVPRPVLHTIAAQPVPGRGSLHQAGHAVGGGMPRASGRCQRCVFSDRKRL